jgi:hypothetical protein
LKGVALSIRATCIQIWNGGPRSGSILVDGVSQRQNLAETGIHWQTLKKILSMSEPPGYKLRKGRDRPKLGPYLERIQQISEEDRGAPP